MADKAKSSLPPPPAEPQVPFVSRLQSLLGKIGIGPQADVSQADLYNQPVAQSRITRTPIYQVDAFGDSRAAEYNPRLNQINVRKDLLQDPTIDTIPHESAHAVYHQGNVAPFANQLLYDQYAPGVGSQARKAIASAPDLYGMMPEGVSMDPVTEMNEQDRFDKMLTNEGLAYSIGTVDGHDYVMDVVNKLRTTNLPMAQKLLRLHENALAVRGVRNSAVSK